MQKKNIFGLNSLLLHTEKIVSKTRATNAMVLSMKLIIHNINIIEPN